jgi:Flp pilus assembly protein TadD
MNAAVAEADAALAKGDFNTARQGYRKVLTLVPGNSAARLGLGEVELVAGDPHQALDHFATVAAADQTLRPGALQGQGITLLKLHQPEAATPILKEAVTLDPGLWRAWNALGSIADSHHDWAAADEAYTKALSAKPDAAIVYNNLGISRMMRQDYTGAEQNFAKALALNPRLDEAVANLRLAQAWQGRYDDAIRGASDQALPQRLNDVGYVAMLRGDLGTAESLFLRAIAASPTYDTVAYKNLEEVQRRKSSAGQIAPAVQQ